jgi:sugar phosphate isomerase/epimerase
MTAKEIEKIRTDARENKLSLAVHFCTINNNLADLNPGHLAESMNQLKETIRLCRRIGSQMVIVHPGTYSEIPLYCESSKNPKLSPSALKEAAVERFKKSLKEASSFAESHDVVIGLENSISKSHCILSTIEDIAEWVDWIDSPALMAALDVGQAKSSELGMVINLLNARIGHVRLHDSNSSGADHAELGTGTIDWEFLKDFLNSFQGMLTLEIMDRTDPEGALLRSKSFLYKLLARA